MQLFEGIARKVAIATIGLTALGWFLDVIGWGIGTVQEGVPRSGSSTLFPFWAVVLVGPIAIVCALAQAAFSKPLGTILGGITTFFGAIFTASLGMNLYSSGQYIEYTTNDPYEDTDLKFFNLTFAGCLIAILFWTITLVLANFYDFKPREAQWPAYERNVQ